MVPTWSGIQRVGLWPHQINQCLHCKLVSLLPVDVRHGFLGSANDDLLVSISLRRRISMWIPKQKVQQNNLHRLVVTFRHLFYFVIGIPSENI
jgi:hypothetical protein